VLPVDLNSVRAGMGEEAFSLAWLEGTTLELIDV
jgi:hypothetical protein